MFSDLAGAGPGAESIPGQTPEQASGDVLITPEEQKRQELQGSIDILIEEWREPDFAWWSGTEEGGHALKLLFQIGELIGQYRARITTQAIDPASNVGDADQAQRNVADARAAAAAARAERQDEIDELKRQLAEAQGTAGAVPQQVPDPPEPSTGAETDPLATPGEVTNESR